MSLLTKIDHRPGGTPVPGTPSKPLEGEAQFLTWAHENATGGKVQTGIWQATPGMHRSVKGESFEFCHILEGVVEITPDGEPGQIFRTGDSFIMNPGFAGTWRTIETVRKIYVTVS